MELSGADTLVAGGGPSGLRQPGQQWVPLTLERVIGEQLAGSKQSELYLCLRSTRRTPTKLKCNYGSSEAKVVSDPKKCSSDSSEDPVTTQLSSSEPELGR